MFAGLKIVKKIGSLTERQKIVLAYGLFSVLKKKGIYEDSDLDKLIEETVKRS